MKPPEFLSHITDRFNRLTHGGKDPRNARGETALYRAVRAGNRSEVRDRLRRGADPNTASENGTTPLHEAAYWGEIDIVRLLLKHGADITRVDDHGWTALHAAAVSGGARTRGAIIALFTAAGARDDVADKQGWSARDYMALWDDNPAAAERLRVMMTGRQTLNKGAGAKPPPPKNH